MTVTCSTPELTVNEAGTVGWSGSTRGCPGTLVAVDRSLTMAPAGAVVPVADRLKLVIEQAPAVTDLVTKAPNNARAVRFRVKRPLETGVRRHTRIASSSVRGFASKVPRYLVFDCDLPTSVSDSRCW